MQKTKTVTVTSVFPAVTDTIWKHLVKVETLQYIAAPFASFKPLTSDDALVWKEGTTAKYRLRVFNLLTMGIQTIQVRQFDQAAGCVCTEESNRVVPLWNHTITLQPLRANTVQYTDVVEIGTGWKTGIVALWSKAFYRHRQKRWLNLLCEA